MTTIMLMLTLLLNTGNSAEDYQSNAKAYISLYSQHDGTPGYPRENWYIKNRSSNEAIKVTIEFWKGNYSFGDKWTRSFSVEPGEIKGIGTKRGNGGDTVNAQVKGARFL